MGGSISLCSWSSACSWPTSPRSLMHPTSGRPGYAGSPEARAPARLASARLGAQEARRALGPLSPRRSAPSLGPPHRAFWRWMGHRSTRAWSPRLTFPAEQLTPRFQFGTGLGPEERCQPCPGLLALQRGRGPTGLPEEPSAAPGRHPAPPARAELEKARLSSWLGHCVLDQLKGPWSLSSPRPSRRWV